MTRILSSRNNKIMIQDPDDPTQLVEADEIIIEPQNFECKRYGDTNDGRKRFICKQVSKQEPQAGSI